MPNAAPDTVTIIDLGPPMSVAITPDQGLALVTSSTKKDPADATKTVPDNRLTVVDLRATPPAVIATLEAGKGAAGVSINRARHARARGQSRRGQRVGVHDPGHDRRALERGTPGGRQVGPEPAPPSPGTAGPRS